MVELDKIYSLKPEEKEYLELCHKKKKRTKWLEVLNKEIKL